MSQSSNHVVARRALLLASLLLPLPVLAADPAPAPTPTPGAGMGAGAGMGKGMGMGMGGGQTKMQGKRCQMMKGHGRMGQMLRMPRLPTGNDKMQLQMEAEILQMLGQIQAKYANQLP